MIKPTILVVEDHTPTREWLQHQLDADYDVVLTHNGVEAIRQLRRIVPDYVLLDVVLDGELDGLHVLDYIRSKAQFDHVPIALVTGKSLEELTRYTTQAVADQHFQKPLDVPRFKRWLQHQQTQSTLP